jgi:ABC-2 type transport system permease protein
MIPLLLKPKLLSIKNSLSIRRLKKNGVQKEIAFAAASLGLVVLVFHASRTTFFELNAHGGFQESLIHSAITLFLSIVGGMVCLSAGISSVGSFYLSHDLDFLSATPLKTRSLLLGKGSEVLLQSSWMMAVFSLPLLAGIGAAVNASYLFYVTGILVIPPLVVTPVALAITCVSVLMRWIPARLLRETLLIAALSMVIYVYLSARHSLFDTVSSQPLNTQALRNFNTALTDSTLSIPSAWSSELLLNTLSGRALGYSHLAQIIALYCIACVSLLAAYCSLKLCYGYALSQIRSGLTRPMRAASKHYERFSLLCAWAPAPARALWLKEMKQFGRDLTQGIQLVMLLGICLVYMYNFKVMNRVNNLSDEMLLWWRGALLVCNVAMGSFIVSAICSRFVFPTMSLDGNSFWVIKKAPLSLSDIVRIKFWIWYPPIAVVSSVILISGALAVDAPPSLLGATLVASIVSSYGLVGTAIGLGCYFVRFDWEHPSQVTSGLGNFVYMMSGTVLIGLNATLMLVSIVLSTMYESGLLISGNRLVLSLTAVMVGLIVLNYVARQWCVSTGIESLERKL